MSQDVFTDETLVAYADGELDPDMSDRVAKAAALDETLQARIEAFARSREAVRDAVAAQVPKDVPPELAAAVRAVVQRAAPEEGAASKVVPFSAAKTSHRSTPWWPSAVAASLALVVGATVGYFSADRQGPHLLTTSGVAPTVAEALSREPTGAIADVGDARIAITGSFRTEAGGLCREVRLEGLAGNTYAAIMCHGDQGWRPDVVVRATPEAGGYQTASGQAALDAHAGALGAGPFLDNEAERAALANLR